MQDCSTTLSDYEELAHKAANETLSITVGVQVLATIPQDQLNPGQLRALKHLEESSSRLVELIEAMKSHRSES